MAEKWLHENLSALKKTVTCENFFELCITKKIINLLQRKKFQDAGDHFE